MRENIVLIDLDLSIIKSISQSKKVNIEYLITEADSQKLKEIKKIYKIKNIISRAKFHEHTVKEKVEINYDIIEKFKNSQLNSEHWQDRLSDDSNLKYYYYINAISFWINIFKKKNISAVILDKMMHGANYDSLALDVAKYFNVAVYVIDYHMERYEDGGIIAARSLLDYSSNERMYLNHLRLNLKPINIKKYLFYIDQIEIGLKKRRKNLKEILKLFLPSFSSAILHMLGYLIRNKLIQHHGLNIRPTKVLKNMIYSKKLQMFYNSISVELDKSKKYIFYAMHFEPEASIMSRARFSNQLSIIKQISQSLPKDWTLYVKEHPDQFKLHENGWWYFLISIHKFRTFDFYKELLKLNNVRLLKEKVKSQDIIKSAKAISTINGSIASEALMYTKPLILFGHQSTPFGLCKEVFKITSTKECEEAMRHIEKGFIPNYSDFNDIVDNYLFELSNLSPNNVEALIDYLVLDYKSNKIKSQIN